MLFVISFFGVFDFMITRDQARKLEPLDTLMYDYSRREAKDLFNLLRVVMFQKMYIASDYRVVESYTDAQRAVFFDEIEDASKKLTLELIEMGLNTVLGFLLLNNVTSYQIIREFEITE